MIENISVTKNHIEKGKKCEGYKCPVALALRDYYKDIYPNIFVGGLCISNVGSIIGCIKPNLRKWITEFDEGKKVIPINIEFKESKFEIIEEK